MKIARRDFLKRSALGAGGLLLAGRVFGVEKAQNSAAKRFDPFERVPLGKSGLQVSRVCMGTGTHGVAHESNQTRLGRDTFQRLLRDAYERGVRAFDTADQYGTHSYVAPALAAVPRDSYTLITKIRWRDTQDGGHPDADVFVDRFLKELQTDYIDLLLIHCMTAGNWPQQMRRQMEILSKYKQKGAIRALGVSCHSIPALESAAREPWVDSVHTRINPYGMSMDGPADQVAPVLKQIHDAGKGVVGMKIIGEGRLRNEPEKRDESAHFVLGLGCVDVLNIGFEKTEEIDDFAGRVRKVPRPV